MRIIFICGAPFVSGKENVILGLVEKLKTDHDIEVITSKWGNNDFYNRITELGVSIYKIRLGFISKSIKLNPVLMTLHQMLFVFNLWYSYIKIVRSKNSEIVVHTNFHHLILLFPILRIGKKNVFYIHESISPTAFYKLVFKILNLKIDAYVGVSEFVSLNFKKIIPAANVNVIYNTVFKLNTNLNLVEKKNIIIISGQVAKWKGHEVLINALKLLKLNGIEFKCYIYGTGVQDYIANLKILIRNSNLENEIVWMGFEKDINKIYSAARLVCVPSLCEEGLGMSALEPAFLGVPVIASNIGGLREIITHNKSGFLFEPNNEGQLAEQIKVLFENEILHEKFSKEIKASTNEKFSNLKILTEWNNLFLSLKSKK
jgi:glycosyltransferase involved in cell wall biosynthesis